MVTIRAATPDDLLAIRDLARRAWQVGYAHLLPKQYLDSLGTEHEPPRVPRSTRSRSPASVARHVAEIDGTIAGATMLCEARDQDLPAACGEVAILNVDPAHWREGVGRALLTEAEAWFRTNNMTAAVLWTLAGNRRGRAFYEACGWKPDGAERTESLTPYALPEIRYRRNVQA